MKGTGERADSGFDRLLRQELGRDAAPPVPCPQVELLAAWYDKSLPPAGGGSAFASGADREEAAAIEAHVAACERCRQVVAGLAASEPEVLYVHPQTQSGPSSWAWHLRWLAPLSAAAAIVLVALVGTQVFRGPQPVSVASSRPASDSAVAGSREERGAAPRGELPARPLPSAGQIDGQPSQPTIRRGRETQGAARTELKSKGLDDAAPVGAAARKESEDAPRGSPELPGTLQVPTAAPTQMMAQAGAARAEAAPAEAATPAPRTVVAPPSPLLAEDKAEPGAHLRTVAVGVTAPTAFAAGGQVGWRYERPGVISRTDDGGANWKAQALPQDARLAVLAPVSPLVCWGAGPSGVIVKTTDGATWQLVPRPAKASFVSSLTAHDALRASVATGDGATYDTADGGRTWQQRRKAP